jgi:hypothetical protein
MDTPKPFDEKSLKFIDEIAEKWGRVTVPFFSNSKKSTSGANLFGSGFIARFKDKNYLVTAHHVAEDMLNYNACVVNINSTGVILENIEFYIDKINDLAIAPIDFLLEKHGIKKISYVPLPPQTHEVPLGYHIILGYPGTKNKLERKWGKINRHFFSITVEKTALPAFIKTTVNDAICFYFDQNCQMDSTLNKIGKPPDLYGMSGGPVFELFVNIEHDHYRFSVQLSGVIVEWHKNDRIVLAAPLTKLVELIKKHKKS